MERLQRADSPALDEIIGQNFKVLDDGVVQVVDYMGNDSAIVQAARVSYGTGTKHISEDRGLIRYLMRHRHTTPFEMCELKLHVRIPMDAWRQWIRHRTASVNEYSTRYSEAIDSIQTTSPEEWRLQTDQNKQGSLGCIDREQGVILTGQERNLHEHATQVYKERLHKGIAREQARKDLPLSNYTEAYWKIDLHNLLHFLGLRMDPHAQKEIRDYANIIGNEIVSRWVPTTWEAFQDYHLNSLNLSTTAQKALQLAIKNGYQPNDPRIYLEIGLVKPGETEEETQERIKKNRERAEIQSILEKLLQ
nr:thymidylate synthase (FAD) [Nanoarchaeum sp.]